MSDDRTTFASSMGSARPYAPRSWEIPASQLEHPTLGDTLDAASSNQLLAHARSQALAIETRRIREAEGIPDRDDPGDRHQGAPRAIRDLDEVDGLTGEPRLYETATEAAAALGVTRAHHVLRAAQRRGRAGGHRVCTDLVYRQSCVALPRSTSDISSAGSERSASSTRSSPDDGRWPAACSST